MHSSDLTFANEIKPNKIYSFLFLLFLLTEIFSENSSPLMQTKKNKFDSYDQSPDNFIILRTVLITPKIVIPFNYPSSKPYLLGQTFHTKFIPGLFEPFSKFSF